MRKTLWFIVLCLAGCVQSELPDFGYNDARYHAGRDVETEDGVSRVDAWIVSRDQTTRYRMVTDGDKLLVEWQASVQNVTDLPRRAAASASFTVNNGGTVKSEGDVVLLPRTSGVVTKRTEVPESAAALVRGATDKSSVLLGGSVTLKQPSPAPQQLGAVLRFIAMKQGKALLSLHTTNCVTKRELVVSAKNAETQTFSLTSKECSWEVTLWNNDTVVLTRSGKAVPDADGRVTASEQFELGLEEIADVDRVTTTWKGL